MARWPLPIQGLLQQDSHVFVDIRSEGAHPLESRKQLGIRICPLIGGANGAHHDVDPLLQTMTIADIRSWTMAHMSVCFQIFVMFVPLLRLATVWLGVIPRLPFIGLMLTRRVPESDMFPTCLILPKLLVVQSDP